MREHQGNALFRRLITLNLTKYRNATLLSREMNSCIASEIVATIRNLNPPGRFLCKSGVTGFWEDIEDDKALKKVAQALRDCYYTAMKNNPGRLNSQRIAAANHRIELLTPIPDQRAYPYSSSNDPRLDFVQRQYSVEGRQRPLHYSNGVNNNLFMGRACVAIILP